MSIFFFFNDTATTEIYTLSLHDALPISASETLQPFGAASWADAALSLRGSKLRCLRRARTDVRDRKSTRLNSSHLVISYAVFCLKQKNLYLTNTTDGRSTD